MTHTPADLRAQADKIQPPRFGPAPEYWIEIGKASALLRFAADRIDELERTRPIAKVRAAKGAKPRGTVRRIRV